MAKSSQALIFISIAVFSLFSLIGFAYCQDDFIDYMYVQGKVYCDTCRTAFPTPVSQYMESAKVRLECHDREGGHLTFSLDEITDFDGIYNIPISGDHEKEICEVVLISSSVPDCKETLPKRDRARVLITKKNGIADVTRYANPLGFLKKKPLPNCADVLKKMNLLPTAIIP